MDHIGRKLYHLMGGVVLLSLYYLMGRDWALVLYTVLFAAVLGLDSIRLFIPAINRFIFKWFGSIIRRNEEHKLTGTAPYILGIGLTLYFYETPVATAAICFLTFGDVAATAVGERYGKIKIGDKSLEGTTAFAVTAICAGLLLMFLGVHLFTWVTILGALVAAGIELYSLRINDNLMIPIFSGGVMELAVRMAR
jgi:dolichol kinase